MKSKIIPMTWSGEYLVCEFLVVYNHCSIILLAKRFYFTLFASLAMLDNAICYVKANMANNVLMAK